MSSKHIFSTLLSPHSIAVIGASRSPTKVGYGVFKNLLEGGFKGDLYPVNPNAHLIQGKKCYPSIKATPAGLDLAVIVTPAPLVPMLVEECGQHGVKALIVISAGFSESGQKGDHLQAALMAVVKRFPLRLIGPNCLGCFSTVNRVNATFGPSLPKPGPIMLISQSGALVTGILDWAKRYDLGISHAVTLGNRIDLSEIEALEYAAQDKNSQIILMYLESFHNAAKLFSFASRVTPHKPILLLKGGQSLAGQAASASHTASLATNYILVKSFASQVGIALTADIQEWLTTAYVLAVCPTLKNDRLGIVTNAGGPGVLATDTAVAQGLNVPEFSTALKQSLSRVLPGIPPHNPLDILGDAPPERFAQAVSLLNKDPALGSLTVIMTPQTTTKPLTTARLIAKACLPRKKPVLAVLLGGSQLQTARDSLEHHGIPTFTYPNEAISTLATVSWYTTHRQQFCLFPAHKPEYISSTQQRDLLHLLTSDLSMSTAIALLKAYSFAMPRSKVITTLEEVGPAIAYVGHPAVLKTASMHLPHKAKLGGVYLGLMTAYHARVITRRLQRLHPQVLFQQTIHSQMELILGCRRDEQLGPFITIGLGGSLTDAIGDRAYAFIPAQKTYLKQILTQTTAFKLMREKDLPLEPVLQALQRLACVLLDFPQISEIEINPAMLTGHDLYACDIKITLCV